MTHQCPRCPNTRWKTLEKNKRYQCRECGHIVTDELKALIIEQYKDNKQRVIYPGGEI